MPPASPQSSLAKLLVCFPKRVTPSEEEQVCLLIADKLEEIGAEVDMVTSSAWFQQTFASAGDYESWIYETVCGKDYHTRRTHFAGFVVVTSDGVGRLTAQIAELALTTKQLVLAFNGEDLSVAWKVETLNADDWQRGWDILTRDIQDDQRNVP